MIDPTARAWAYLSRVAEPPCAQLAALVRCVGPVEAADRVRRGQVGNELAQHTGARREIDRAADDLELLMRPGGGHLDGEPCLGLAHHIGEVRRRLGGGVGRGDPPGQAGGPA